MTAPLDQSILDLLRGSSLAPLIDRPVNDILRDIGLGPIPDIGAMPPLPGLPPLPIIDLSAIMRPFTDLQQSFGTGVLNNTGPGGGDPMQALGGITQGLQTAMQLGSTALQMVMQLWQSTAAMQAANKAGQAAQDGTEIATQSAQEKTVLADGAGSVAVGGALMAAVIAKYIATMTAASPLLASPGGQYFLVAQTAESLAEATATVVKTRTELAAHSANMTAVGQKVPVTAAPVAADTSAQGMQQMMQMVQPLMQMAQTGMQTATQLAPLLIPKTDPAKELAAKEAKEKEDRERELSVDGAPHSGAGGGPGGFGGGPGGFAPVAQPLAPWSGTRAASVGPLPGLTGSASAPVMDASVARAAAITPGAGAASPGMMPMGGPMGAAGAKEAHDASTVTSHLVTGQHGDEVVGKLDGISLPVVGAAESISDTPPDKELTL
ncbi:hypothetical protein D5S18_23255 [Nocardia panacis]|uniref:Uncharacterized protein n=1 Tax=Nocardia panacis TaxID=2340916 RepID=A0A3A4JRG1_9NOCA|nr:hypothetical protein [Nocardia panacis]RJO72099.1 hypothetical protein D5S18_23255 [Nocardia panacis]